MLTLNATIRKEVGKNVRKIRKEGKLPAVLYGRKVKSTPLALDYKNFEKIYKDAGESTLISLELENVKEAKDIPSENVVLIRNAEFHSISRLYTHVDFYQVPMDKEIDIDIPLVFINESPVAANGEGVLVRNVYEINVSALPKNLPRDIAVDLSSLKNIDDSITVKDLNLPPDVKFNAEGDLIIALVAAPQEEEIPAETEAVSMETIKTEAEEKRNEKAKEEQAEE